MTALLIVVVALAAALGMTSWSLIVARKALRRYSSITDVERYRDEAAKQIQASQQQLAILTAEITSYQHHVAGLRQELELAQQTKTTQQRAAELQQEILGYEQRVTSMQQELRAVEEAVELQSFGFYQPHYGLESSEEYAQRLKVTREQQKTLVKNDRAAHCPAQWTVEGSAAKGRKMVEEHTKLMLRAFNGECDAAIAKVKYNNIVNLERRIEKSFEAINKLGKSKQIWISKDYLNLKLSELRLVHEHREKVQEEKEEQRRIKEEMREEQKAQKEIEKAKEAAEKEEIQYQQALDKARKELADSTGKQHDRLEQLVNKLQAELSQAIDRKAKAISRAQLTRSGHVYVISNVGSFGDTVYKIGMTRRLEPLERVKELGDASVPFKFDVHAMIYCEDAPALENALHNHFADRRLNRVNLRREFFRVSLDEIRHAVAKYHGIITFVTVPEAEEYRKTLAMEEQQGGVGQQVSGVTIESRA